MMEEPSVDDDQLQVAYQRTVQEYPDYSTLIALVIEESVRDFQESTMDFKGLITIVTVADYKVNLEQQAISTTTIVTIDSGMQVRLMEVVILDLGKVISFLNLEINQPLQGLGTTTVVIP